MPVLTSDITLTPDQQRAADAIQQWVAGTSSYFVLHGLAGTGKTTVISKVARDIDRATHLCAPTGKAASVLAGKTGLRASTLHKLLYSPVERLDDAGISHLDFVRTVEPEELAGSITIVDEASMVSESIAKDLLDSGTRVIACGDPGQLPPVSDRPFFSEPNYTLTEIHRQAAQSAVVRQAYNVRHGRPYHNDGADFQIVNVTDDDLDWADMILCWRNGTRRAINSYFRRRRGIAPDDYPKKGEPLVCLRNNRMAGSTTGKRIVGVMNGETFTVASDYCRRTWLYLDDDLAIANPHFYALTDRPPERGATQFDFAYALTVHKAQGSEWAKVLVIDEYRGDERAAWLYTAVTRASQAVRICRA